MSRLTAEERKGLPASTFAGPHRSFPIPDKGHAEAALRDIPRAERKGTIDASEAAEIRAKARRKLMAKALKG